jgi:hypothetical protein
MPKGIYNRTDEHKKKLKENFGNEVGFSYWTGKHRSEETKKKLSKFHTGKLASPETKKKMSLAHKGKNTGKDSYWFGKQSPNWKGGVTPEKQLFSGQKEWKQCCKDIWKRDNATCQRCKERFNHTQQTFEVHHIRPFWTGKQRTDYANLILVCRKCHTWIHSKKNLNRNFILIEKEQQYIDIINKRLAPPETTLTSNK